MNVRTYVHYEIVRLFRNYYFFVFSLIFPLLLFYIIAGSNKDAHISGIPFPVYYLAGMVAWGTMAAVISGGARIAAERSVGWNRQLRLTPLRPSHYLATKVLTGYVMAAMSIVLLYLAGLSLGVRLDIGGWLGMTGLVLIGLVPFAAFGILIGHLASVETMGPLMGGTISLFALLGGSWFPFGQGSWVQDVLQLIPSYWITQASQIGVHGGSWPAEAWIVVAVWTIVLAYLARWAYVRDTARV